MMLKDQAADYICQHQAQAANWLEFGVISE